MKKSLIVLPFLAFMLTGCLSLPGFGGGDSSSSSSSGTNTTKTAPTNPPTLPSVPTIRPKDEEPPSPETYDGYRRVLAAPEDGKEYLLGCWHVGPKQDGTNESPDYTSYYEEMRFFNGHHHVKGSSEYPYYLSTSTEVSKATKVKIEYTDATHYRIKITDSGEYRTYANKYLMCYKYSNYSSCMAADPDDESTLVDPSSKQPITTYNFDWYYAETLTDMSDGKEYTVQTNACDVEVNGTKNTFIHAATSYHLTFAACWASEWERAYICHLWEPIS